MALYKPISVSCNIYAGEKRNSPRKHMARTLSSLPVQVTRAALAKKRGCTVTMQPPIQVYRAID